MFYVVISHLQLLHLQAFLTVVQKVYKSQLNPSQVMSYEPKPVTLEALCFRDTRESHGTPLVVSPLLNALLPDCVTARYGIADSVTPADNSWLRAPQFEDQSAAWEKRRADSLVNGQ